MPELVLEMFRHRKHAIFGSQISWDGHLCGAMACAIVAYALTRTARLKSQKSLPPGGLAGEQTSALRKLRCSGEWLYLSVRCAIAVVTLTASAPSASAQGFASAEAARRMSVAEGLEVRLVASEPLIRQPVAIEFDDRGRLWVIQYLQYPNPAQLKRVSVDRYSRTVYDRFPDPPPRGPNGADRITILEDADGDGRADRSHDFVEGLNFASGLAFGNGGVFVIQAPYLLFYPDRNRDDRPDGEPEVLLSGFGMEDAHSVANSLTWGPDGWLYGLQGSTVTAKIRGIEFQQGIWRYHPTRKQFELFCEGGGNMWGLDFDRFGQLFASTNLGGFVMLHGVQGGYFWKAFGKHGPLHNPYTFGYFDHVRHSGLTGGHVSVGGLFYEADALPPVWRGRFIAADLLGHAVRTHEVTPSGSTFQSRQIGDVLRANDTWFAPSDQTIGPDGGLYIADWHDRRTAHPDPDADWDRTNGRIFAVTARGARAISPGERDLTAKTDDELVALLNHANVWYRRKARRLLAERSAVGTVARLRDVVIASRGTAALEALWALYGCVGLDEVMAEAMLRHPDADVRSWCVRLIGDEPNVSSQLSARLIELATNELDVKVRSQFACTAQRLSASKGLEVAERLLLRDLDRDDPRIPLLLWWAVERHVFFNLEGTLARFTSPEAWRSGMVRSTVLERLVRRLAAEKNEAGDAGCARVLGSAPSVEARRPLLLALDHALSERHGETIAPQLAKRVIELAANEPVDMALIRLAARVGSQPAIVQARRIVADARAPETDRVAMLNLLGDLKDRASLAFLLETITGKSVPSPVIRRALVAALGRFDDPAIASTILKTYPQKDQDWQLNLRALLLSRVEWAKSYLAAIDRGDLKASDITLDQLGQHSILRDPGLAALVRKHWGVTRGATREERLAEVRRLNNDLRADSGDPARGRLLFRDRCAACHRLHGEGATIGPDLTYANRQDRDYLLVSLVDPAGVVRKEYQVYNIATKDGRVLTGLISEQTPDEITLCNSKSERTRVPRSEIEELTEADTSLMPDSLYKEFNPAQLRDLFAFLQSSALDQRKGQP